MSTPLAMRDFDLTNDAGLAFEAIPLEEAVAQFAALAGQKPFHHAVLGDLVPQSIDALRQGLGPNDEYAAWRVQNAPPSFEGASVWLSFARGVPQASVWREQGRFDPEADPPAMVAVADALFRHRPREAWLMFVFAKPEPSDLEEVLTPWGFERVTGAFDQQMGEVMYGLRREVREAQLAAQQFEDDDDTSEHLPPPTPSAWRRG